jgi:hypothetical protein
MEAAIARCRQALYYSERSDLVTAIAGRGNYQPDLKASEFLEKKRPDAQVAPIALTSQRNCLRAAQFHQ